MQQSHEKKPRKLRDKDDADLTAGSGERKRSREGAPRARRSALEPKPADVRWDIDPPDKRS